jgi:hypothetical protein
MLRRFASHGFRFLAEAQSSRRDAEMLCRAEGSSSIWTKEICGRAKIESGFAESTTSPRSLRELCASARNIFKTLPEKHNSRYADAHDLLTHLHRRACYYWR